jgi:hypothetical protein
MIQPIYVDVADDHEIAVAEAALRHAGFAFYSAPVILDKTLEEIECGAGGQMTPKPILEFISDVVIMCPHTWHFRVRATGQVVAFSMPLGHVDATPTAMGEFMAQELERFMAKVEAASVKVEAKHT